MSRATSGRQAVRSNTRIVLLAQNWAETGDQEARNALSNAIDTFQTSHERIISGHVGDEKNIVPDSVLAIMYDPPHELDKTVSNYVALATTVEEKGRDASAELSMLKELIKPAAAEDITLLGSLNDVVTGFERMHISQIGRMKNVQNAAVLVLAIALVLEALVIFRPLVRRVNGLTDSLKKASISDPMTNIYNRRGFMASGEQKISNSSHGAVIILDIDHFKKINDLHGHAAGDACIVHTTQVARTVFRLDDTIGRIGGEEFAVVVPGAPEKRALELAEQLREAVDKTPCDTRDVNTEVDCVSFTISVGVCFYEEPRPLSELIQNADAALYDAKRDGRNRVQSTSALATMTFRVGEGAA